MSLALLKESGIDVLKLSSSPKSSMEYLTLIRGENTKKVDKNLVTESKDIDVLAINYLTMPQFKESNLVTAVLLKEGMSGELIKILSNIIPKEMVAKILNISMTNLSHQYKRKSLDKAQTESVVGFLKIWSELMSLFKNQNETVIKWLNKEKGPLCGNTPMSLMDTASGREAVLDMIYRIKTGDFS